MTCGISKVFEMDKFHGENNSKLSWVKVPEKL